MRLNLRNIKNVIADLFCGQLILGSIGAKVAETFIRPGVKHVNFELRVS